MFHFRSFAAIGLGVMFCQRYVLWCHCLDTELSLPISAMLTAVEEKRWKLGISSGDNTCLIGKTDCKIPLKPPLEKNSFPPEVLPVSKNAEYQKLALTAETIVPKTWWRAAFMSPELLLYKSPADGPKVFYDPKKSLAHKRLRNLYQCSTRQDFIRKPFPFAPAPAEGKCHLILNLISFVTRVDYSFKVVRSLNQIKMVWIVPAKQRQIELFKNYTICG